MGSAVQFRGKQAVLQAYEDRGVPSWAMFQAKQFLMPCVCTELPDGAEQLNALLEKLEQGGTNAIYTLKVYEDIPGGKIKENTPSDGSFNFQLNNEAMTVYQGKQQYIGSIAAIESKLSAIERKLEEKPETEGEPTTYDKIMDFAETSTGKMVIGTLLGAIFKTSSTNQFQHAVISGVPNAAGDEEKLTESIRILKRHDPQLPDHLFKLAQIATTNPGTFEMLIGMLDKL